MLKNVIANMRHEGLSIEKIANLLSLSPAQVKTYFKELDAEARKKK